MIQVHCPQCQHQQSEPEGVVSTNCKACGGYIRVSEIILKPAVVIPKAKKNIVCTECSTKIRVVESALSTICPHCSAHLNLQDYRLSAGDNDQVNTIGTVFIHGRRPYEGKQIQASRLEISCKASARFMVREIAILRDHAQIEGKLEAPQIEIALDASTRARLLLTPYLKVEGEIFSDQVRAKKIQIHKNGSLIAKRIFCEELTVEPGGFLKGRLITLNREAQSLIEP